ncbi:MAG TPA: SDR family NAD(P)-dependent oxidoreductase [Pseudomonadales bacterium]
MAGASEGLGLAFAEVLAERGYDLLLIARRAALLDRAATRLSAAHGVTVATRAADLGDATIGESLRRWLLEAPPSLAVYNAASVPVGELIEQSEDDLLDVVRVNVRAPLVFARAVGRSMADRGGGGLLLMSSLAGFQGSPRIAAYAASKAFNTVLAEGLWHELRPRGVRVSVCCAGAIRTPGFAHASGRDAPGTLDARAVAMDALDGLGRGPRSVPGWINRIAALVVGRWLPRRAAIGIMAGAAGDLQS